MKYKRRELDDFFTACRSRRDVNKIRKSTPRLTKDNLCKYIKLSPRYKESALTKFKYKQHAKLVSRNVYQTRSNILAPLVKPIKLTIDKTIQFTDLFRVLNLASKFKDIACIYYPFSFSSKANAHTSAGIIYTVTNTFAPKDIDRSEIDKSFTPTPINSTFSFSYPPLMWERMNNCKKRFFVIFVHIKANRIIDGKNHDSRHSNVLIYDRILREIERFEPFGYTLYSSNRYQFLNLDKEFDQRFRRYKIKHISPVDFEPRIGFQKQELIQFKALDEKDPADWSRGTCSAWTYTWVALRLGNPQLTRDQLFIRIETAFRKLPVSLTIFIASLVDGLNEEAKQFLISAGYKLGQNIKSFLNDNYPKVLKSYNLPSS